MCVGVSSAVVDCRPNAPQLVHLVVRMFARCCVCVSSIKLLLIYNSTCAIHSHVCGRQSWEDLVIRLYLPRGENYHQGPLSIVRRWAKQKTLEAIVAHLFYLPTSNRFVYPI